MIALVGVFTIYFYVVNRQQAMGKKVLEGVVSLLNMIDPLKRPWLISIKPGFRHTY